MSNSRYWLLHPCIPSSLQEPLHPFPPKSFYPSLPYPLIPSSPSHLIPSYSTCENLYHFIHSSLTLLLPSHPSYLHSHTHPFIVPPIHPFILFPLSLFIHPSAIASSLHPLYPSHLIPSNSTCLDLIPSYSTPFIIPPINPSSLLFLIIWPIFSISSLPI